MLAKNEIAREEGSWALRTGKLWAALAVGLAAFAAYVFAATPTAYPLDSSELAAATFGLGVAHPPGEETTLLFAKAFTLVPFGGVAFKVALSQAFAGALSVVLVFLLTFEAVAPFCAAGKGERRSFGPRGRTVLAVVAALLFAYAPGVVISSNRAEVYATQTALSLGALYLALQSSARRDPRLALLAAMLIGFGVGNHSLLAGLVGLGAVVAAWPLLSAPEPRVRLVLLSFAGLAVGVLVHAYIPLRTLALFAAPDRGMNNVLWGDARTVSGLWWVVSAKTFAEKTNIVHGHASPFDLPFLPAEELGALFALLALAGAYFMLRRRDTRGGGLALLVGALGSMTAALVGGLDPGNPDIRGYLCPGLALLAVLSGCAIALVLSMLRIPQARAALLGLCLVFALVRLPSPSSYPGLRHAAAADVEVRDMLIDLPPTAALLTFHFETGFLVGYQRLVEGGRPDISWVHLAFASGPGYAERARARMPELDEVIDAYRRRSGLLPALAALDHRHPVRIEPDTVTSLEIRRALGPAGELWAPLASTTPDAPRPLLAWAIAEAAHDHQVRGYLAWRNYIDAVWSCDSGFVERARERFAELEKLVPNDESYLELRARCQ